MEQLIPSASFLASGPAILVQPKQCYYPSINLSLSRNQSALIARKPRSRPSPAIYIITGIVVASYSEYEKTITGLNRSKPR
jgi:hypothetical protein